MKEFYKFLKVLTFLLLLNTMITISIIILHELGHATLGALMDCERIKISINFPSITVLTEMNCYKGLKIIPLGAFLFTIPFSFFFIFVGPPENKLFWIGLGLSLFTASEDLANLIGSKLSFVLFLFLGLVIYLYGEDELIKSIVQTNR